MTWLLPLTIIIPLTGAGLTLVASRRPRVQRVISVGTLTAQLVVELVMLFQVAADGPIVMHVGGWTAPFGITLVADHLASFMLVVSTIVSLAVLVYAISQGMADSSETPETPVSIFHPTFLILVTGVSNAFIAGDLFNLFVSFEILLTASYVLLTLGRDEGAAAGRRALHRGVAAVSSLIFLSAIAMLYAATGTVNLADLSVKLADAAGRHRRRAAGAAAGGVRRQGGGLPDVGVAAGLLSERPRAGHRGVRRFAHQGGHLRDHPGADAAVPDRARSAPC